MNLLCAYISKIYPSQSCLGFILNITFFSLKQTNSLLASQRGGDPALVPSPAGHDRREEPGGARSSIRVSPKGTVVQTLDHLLAFPKPRPGS